MKIFDHSKLDLIESREKGGLLKDALHIVNELAENNLGDIDGELDVNNFDWEQLQDLIIKARKLKKNRWWDVPRK